VTILCYHSVEPDWDHPLAVSPDGFAAHCAWLARRRRVLPLREAVERMDAFGRLPAGSAALTFDDGFEALRAHAMPVLTRHALPATVFLVAQTLTEQGKPVDWVDRAPGHRLTTLDLDQVLEMQDAGVDFQSHSFAHHDLTSLTLRECVEDLRSSRELLGDLLGRPVDLLAYPRGRHDAQVREAAARAGYRYAFALPVGEERPGPFAVPRVGIYRGNRTGVVRMKSSPRYLPLRTHPRVAGLQRRLRSLSAP
jgi:peptidoglycan/xylan/chitin deacetylase (PgdA/CDA1 family)